MNTTRTAWALHRWLAWIVGLQLLIWVTSGIVFAWLPFKSWVKGEDLLRRPALELAAGWSVLPPEAAAIDAGKVSAARLVATPQGPVWRLSVLGEPAPRWLPADATSWTPPQSAAVRGFAEAHYAGEGRVVSVEHLEHVPRRLGLVEETGGRAPVWRVGFDDWRGTRLYFDGTSGEFLTIRSEAWVWYDFFWRLHIMDYQGGEDFNNLLLRLVATAGWLMAAAGAWLAVLAARRAWRRR